MSSVHALLNSYSNLTKTRPCLTETGKWQNWDDWSWLCRLLATWTRTCFLTLLSLKMEAREWRSWCRPPAESSTLSRGSSYATWVPACKLHTSAFLPCFWIWKASYDLLHKHPVCVWVRVLPTWASGVQGSVRVSSSTSPRTSSRWWSSQATGNHQQVRNEDRPSGFASVGEEELPSTLLSA